MLRWSVLVLFAWLVGSLPTAAAMLERDDFGDGHRTALAFDLSNESTIRAELLSLPAGPPQLSFLGLPFAIKNLFADERNVVFLWTRRDKTIFSYNMRPNRTSSMQLATFVPIFTENSPLEALIKDAEVSEHESNLYFIREGLQRLFLLRLTANQEVELEGGAGSKIEVANPDLVAIQLPENYIGRTFPSGRMYDPEPLKRQPIVIFSATESSLINTNLPCSLRVAATELGSDRCPHWVEGVRVALTRPANCLDRSGQNQSATLSVFSNRYWSYLRCCLRLPYIFSVFKERRS